MVGGAGVLERLRRFARPGGEYECQRCGRQYERRRQICADCGGFSIERDWGCAAGGTEGDPPHY